LLQNEDPNSRVFKSQCMHAKLIVDSLEVSTLHVLHSCSGQNSWCFCTRN